MPDDDRVSVFNSVIHKPEKPADAGAWLFTVLPVEVSESLPRRGRTSIEGQVNGAGFSATLEPDGQLSHWLKLDPAVVDAARLRAGQQASFAIKPMSDEPEPEVPADLDQALTAHPQARAVWQQTTTLARVDWVHWVESAKQDKTRAKRIHDACDMLAEGKRRVCCFDPSGFYSKALRAPKAAPLSVTA